MMRYTNTINRYEMILKIENQESYETWGDVCLWNDGHESYGVEYNLCYDFTAGVEGSNESAFYVYDSRYGTDESDCHAYEIDFSDPDWEEKIFNEARRIFNERFRREN